MKVDFDAKEAFFVPKKGEKCDIEQVKKAITDAGYKVASVKTPVTK